MHETVPTWAEFVAGWDLYREPVVCGVLAGLLLGWMGVFIVLRRTVFVTAAVSQSAGLGVALTFYLDITFGLHVPPAVGAIALALATTAVFALPLERVRVGRESILGLVYLAGWAGAVLVGDRIAQESHDIAAILFGTAVLVRPADLHLLEVVALVVLATHLLAHRGLVFAAFDPQSARVQGLPVQALDLVSWLLVALAVSAATRALGVLPVFAFAVVPAVTALQLTRRIGTTLLWSTLLGGAAGGLGYLLAFFRNFPVGASQAATALTLCAAVVGVRSLVRLVRPTRPAH